MKIHEILREEEDDYASSGDFAHNPESPHAADNLASALIDMGMQEFMKIEDDPAQYFAQRGERISPQQAQQISQALGSVDDKTFDLMGKSKMVQRAIESNYDSEQDASYLPLDVVMQIIQKVQARG